jgi:hypothetical protein
MLFRGELALGHKSQDYVAILMDKENCRNVWEAVERQRGESGGQY